MAFVENDLREALKSVLAIDGGVHARYDEILTKALVFAANEISSALAFRGYSAAQIAQWDRYDEFKRDLSIWKTLQDAIMLAPKVEASRVDRFDRRNELTGCGDCTKAVGVTIGGVAVLPDTNFGGCSFGRLNTDGDVFVFPDPLDPNLGEVTQL